MKIAIIGTGVYALATANKLSKTNKNIWMWTEKENIKEVIAPKEVIVSNKYEDVIKDSKVIFILVAGKFIKSVLDGMKDFIIGDELFVIGSKGIMDDGTLIYELIQDTFNNPVGVLSGPTFAVDVNKCEPTGFTFATKNKKDYETVKNIYNESFIEYSSDLKAISLAGTLKNVYAIGNGIIDGLNLGYSAKCLLVYKAFHEMKNIFKNFGSSDIAIETLAGFGDLVLTSTSPTSRNFTFGRICSFNDEKEKENFLKNNTVEGYENLKVFNTMFKKENIKSPLLNSIYEVVIENKNSKELITSLLHY